MNRLAVVVLNWNDIADTQECLASLWKQTQKDFDIILVDNGSIEEGTSEFLAEAEKTDRIIVLRNAVNKGFAGGVNTGIRYTVTNNYSYVALFNNDAVAETNWLSELVIAATEQKSGITTGLLLHRDGATIDSTGDYCSNWGLPFPRSRGQLANTAPESGEVFSGSGGASLYDIEMLDEIGLFDETFFAYYEDTDISFRAQLYGYNVFYTNKAIAYHKQGATSSKLPGFTVKQTFKNLPLFIAKNIPTRLLLTVGPRFWLAYLLIFGNAVKKGNGRPALTGYLQSIYYFWKSALPARLKIQKNKKLSAEDVKKKLWPDLPPDQTGLRKFRQLFTGKS